MKNTKKAMKSQEKIKRLKIPIQKHVILRIMTICLSKAYHQREVKNEDRNLRQILPRQDFPKDC